MNSTEHIHDTQVCPVCGSAEIATSEIQENFDYIADDQKVTLTARFPVETCKNCSFVSYGEEGERAKDAAIRGHLKLLKPAEIKSIREKYQLSRQAFAALTGIGVASLARWENAELLQNRSSDNLLRFISDSENFRILKEGFNPREGVDSNTGRALPRFKALHGEELEIALRLQEGFSLHIKANI